MRGLRKPLSHTNRTFRGTELFVSPFSPFLPYGQKYIPSHTPPPALVQTLGPAFGLSRMLNLLCRQTSKPSQAQEVTVLKYSNTLRIRQKPRFAVNRLLWLMPDSQSRPLRSDPGVRSHYVRERLSILVTCDHADRGDASKEKQTKKFRAQQKQKDKEIQRDEPVRTKTETRITHPKYEDWPCSHFITPPLVPPPETRGGFSSSVTWRRTEEGGVCRRSYQWGRTGVSCGSVLGGGRWTFWTAGPFSPQTVSVIKDDQMFPRQNQTNTF